MLVVLGALCTALLSGVVAALATYSMNSNKEHIFFVRQKAEDLYYNFEVYSINIASYGFAHYPFIKGEISISELYEYLLKNTDSDKDIEAPKKVSMLVEIYFPEILHQFKRMHEAREAVNSIIEEAKREAKRNGGKLQGGKRFADFHRATGHLASASDDFKAAIIGSGRAVAQFDALSPRIIQAVRERLKRTRSLKLDG